MQANIAKLRGLVSVVARTVPYPPAVSDRILRT
jgi:hypothetical protein